MVGESERGDAGGLNIGGDESARDIGEVEVGAGEYGLIEVGEAEIGAAQVCAGEVGLFEVGGFELAPAHLCPIEPSIGHICPRTAGSSKDAIHHGGARKIDAFEICRFHASGSGVDVDHDGAEAVGVVEA